MLEQSNNLVNNLGLKLEQIIGFNANNIYVSDTSLEAFYKGYYSEEKSSIIGYLTLEDDGNESEEISQISTSQKTNEGQSEGRQGSANTSSQGGGSQNEHIVNQGQAVLLKSGKKVALLDIDHIY